MPSDASKFINCLVEAEQLLEHIPGDGLADFDHVLSYENAKNLDLAIFEKCSEFLRTEPQQPPPIRIIQHLSCTGGTLISKCLAGLPNVILLGECNPVSQLQENTAPRRFAPSDLISLATRAKLPHMDDLVEDIFRADIALIANQARLYGKRLVVREHSHSDFLVGDTTNEFSVVRKFLSVDFPTLSVLTVRHPVDSYLSLVRNEWLHFTPKTFDEYCRRYMLFLDCNMDVPITKYEDFVNDPQSEMKKMCRLLDLPFNDAFLDVFDLNVLSGDSGRSSNVIEKRERHEFDEAFRAEASDSHHYRALCARLNYDSALGTPTGRKGEDIHS